MKHPGVTLATAAGPVRAIAPLVLSASRATDLPAFHVDWFLDRLAAGFCEWRNPFNGKIQFVSFARARAAVFWSKNPAPLLKRLDEVDSFGLRYYFHFTLNDYGQENLEPGVPPLRERIATFRALARRIGPEKLVWRYDPIAFSPRYDATFHCESFRRIAEELAGCTTRCITSFLDFYARTRRNLAGTQVREPAPEECRGLASELAVIASRSGIRLETCAESGLPLPPAACIGSEWIEAICGHKVGAKKDSGQRKLCNCIRSIDIGTPDCCPHGCRYCYANRSPESARHRAETAYDPDSPFLCSSPAW